MKRINLDIIYGWPTETRDAMTPRRSVALSRLPQPITAHGRLEVTAGAGIFTPGRGYGLTLQLGNSGINLLRKYYNSGSGVFEEILSGWSSYLFYWY